MEKKKIILEIALAAVFICLVTACSGGGGKKLNSPQELSKYLNKQPANNPDKPIKVTMDANDLTLKEIVETLKSAGKYVSLNLSGDALTTISERAFESCDTLVSVNIPNSVTSIGELAFWKCTYLNSVTIPDSVTRIEAAAFSQTGLTGIIIPDSVTSIGYNAFGSCKSLTSVNIPDGVNYILSLTFYGCTSLTGVTIPDSVEYIGYEAFYYCKSLTGITIPNSVTNIEESAFAFCDNLTSVTFQGADISISYNKDYPTFPGDLEIKYNAGGIGTYTRPNGDSKTWTKQ